MSNNFDKTFMLRTKKIKRKRILCRTPLAPLKNLTKPPLIEMENLDEVGNFIL